MDIAKQVYLVLPNLPDYEKFGLQTQLSRAAGSVPFNIAEGSAKSSNKDFKRFLEIALGSAYELETHLILTKEIHKIDTSSIMDTLQVEQKMLAAFINKL